MKNNILISVGIPAYNEQENIKNLLESLLSQKTPGINLEVVVISDGSTDATVQRATSLKDSRVKVINNKSRSGKNNVLAQIARAAKGSALIYLDADVLPKGDDFIFNLVQPIIEEKADLVAAKVKCLKPAKFLERIFVWGHDFRTATYDHINKSGNIYHCYGRGLSLSKRLYSKLSFPMSVPDDAYLYFLAISKGYKFFVANNAIVQFRMVSTVFSQMKQSNRFVLGKETLKTIFSKDLVISTYYINTKFLIMGLFEMLKTQFIRTIICGPIYFGLQVTRALMGKIIVKEDKFSKQSMFEGLSETKRLVSI